jgi:hypothetical protein
MPPTVTDVAAELKESNRRLAEAIDGLKTTIHGLDTRVAVIESNMGFFRKVGWTVAGFVGATFLTALAITYQAGQVVNAVNALQKDFAEMRTDLKQMRHDVSEVKGDIKAQAGQLDRIEKSLAQNRPGPSQHNQ